MKLTLPKELTRITIYFLLKLIGVCAGVWGIFCNNAENTIITVPAIFVGLLSVTSLVFEILIKPFIRLTVDSNFPIKDIVQVAILAPITWFTVQYISQEKQQMEMFGGYVKDMTTLLMSKDQEEGQDVHDELLRAQTRVAWQAFDRRRRIYLLLLVSKTSSSTRIRDIQLLRNLDESYLDLSCPGIAFEFYFYPSFQIRSANASCRELRTGNLDKIYLPKVNLTNVDLSYSSFKESALMEAKLDDANLRNSNFQNANLIDAHLKYVKLSGGLLSNALLSGADLEGTELIEADLNGAHLISANLSCAKLNGAKLIGADLRDAKLEGADLGGANLENTEMTGVNLLNVKADKFTKLDNKWKAVYAIVNWNNLPAEIIESYKRDTKTYLESGRAELSDKDVSEDTQKIFSDNLKAIRTLSKTHAEMPDQLREQSGGMGKCGYPV